jgi:NAD+ synthetase
VLEISKDYPIMYHNAVYQGVLYLQKYPRIKTFVIGLSGGIDSAVSALLARRVCDSMGKQVKLIGVSIPIESNKPDEVKRAKMIGNSICDVFIEKNLTTLWRTISYEIKTSTDEEEFQRNVRLGNSKARLRMMYLYNLAQANQGLVLSTDNLTEYYLGFWTLHGDVGDFCFIQNLWKSEVYGLANWILESFPTFPLEGMRECYDAVPTDGLGVSESDLHQLVPHLTIETVKKKDKSPFYRELYTYVDRLIIKYLNDEAEGFFDYASQVSIIDRIRNTQYKRENPYNVPREKLFAK